MKNRKRTFALILCALVFGIFAHAPAQQKSSQAPPKSAPAQAIPNDVILRIVRAEDERRYDNDLGVLLFDKDPRVRARASLAAGRIGDERAVASLVNLLQTDKEASVRSRAAFALGEIESVTGAAALSEALEKTSETNEVRARSIEALGKIAAALPKTDEERVRALG
ncbi:MAG: HEAT repeat domain-containing protein, partial [Acidobacteriota bacterium]|nr:HEAT repeat domain-containing protein [Acidobacteriota bacterium]